MAISSRERIQALPSGAMAEVLSGRRRHFTNGYKSRDEIMSLLSYCRIETLRLLSTR